MLEPGWSVAGTDGTELGKVDQVAGDTATDIFDGLIVKAGPLQKRRYVPAELVTTIVEGRVQVSLGPEEFEHLDEYVENPPPGAVRPETESTLDRIAGALRRAFGSRNE